jgi:P-aminobenzoate N-oxygenase AurF
VTTSQVLSAADLDETLIGGEPVENKFTMMMARLSKLSVEQHFDAYADIDWDAPEMAIDAADPRWELPDFEPLAHTEWYQSQDAETRSRIGLYRAAQMLHTGWQFENILQVGILIFAMRLPKQSPKFRYMYHELIEEGQHSMMFHEFVRRADMPTRGMSRPMKMLVRPVLMAAAKWQPMGLFVGALAGEEPADYVQRRQVKLQHPHPLLDQIIRIHVTEEARHISFARHYIRHEVPRMGRIRRTTLSILMPIVMMIGARLMLDDSRNMRREFKIPRKVMRSAYSTPEARQRYADSVSKVRSFCGQVGLMGRVGTATWNLVTRFG